MGDGLEQPRYNPADGMVYLTSSGQNAILQFDPTGDVFVKTFAIGTKCDPNGIAIQSDHEPGSSGVQQPFRERHGPL